jgi:enediyne biosynthesis protein E4
MELIVGGNYYGTDAEFSRYDASIGNILRTGKDGAFDVLPFAETGLILDGNVRQLRILEIGKEPYLLMVRNNDSFKLFKPTRITKK